MNNANKEYLPEESPIIDLLKEEEQAHVPTIGGSTPPALKGLVDGKEINSNRAGIDPVLRVLKLDEILNYEPAPGSFLVGDGVIEMGGDSLLYGPPGSYKGFAVGQLMACGARGSGEWLGFQIKTQFASLWLNFENRKRRLRDQFSRMNLPPDAEKRIFVTDIPGVWSLSDVRLANAIRDTIVENDIKLLIVDTVSCLVEDELAKQFAAFFGALNTMLHGIEPRPAVLLIHHSRKPKETDKGARALLHLISGHQTLQRRARSICYLGRVTDEFKEDRVAAVWLKVSDSGESEGRKTALKLGTDAELHPIHDFNWDEWSGGKSHKEAGSKRKVTEEHLRELFADGKPLRRSVAATRLEEIAGIKSSAAYDALKQNGPFQDILVVDQNQNIVLRELEDFEDAS